MNSTGATQRGILRLALGLLLSSCLVACIEVETEPAVTEITGDERRNLDNIAALGYVNTVALPADEPAGVVYWDSGWTQPGYNLSFSGHENEALLLDMDGQVLHRWQAPYEELFPGKDPYVRDNWKLSWANGLLLPGGDLVAIQPGIGLFRLSRDSEIVWVVEDNAHHDLYLDDRDRLHVLTRGYAPIEGYPERKFRNLDQLTVYTLAGEKLDEISIEEAYAESGFDPATDDPRHRPDPFHANAIEWLDGRHVSLHPAFARGNVLVSLRNTHTLAIYDPGRRKIVWQIRGEWDAQHDPGFTQTGTILLFDNRGSWKDHDRSRVIEIDSISGEIIQEFVGDPGRPIRSYIEGAVTELANGNILAVDSRQARAIEITPDHRIVWEYVNPYHGGVAEDEGGRAVLHELFRIPAAEVDPWLKSISGFASVIEPG